MKVLALDLAFSFPSRSVVAEFDYFAAIFGYPRYLRIDYRTELTSKILQQWSEDHCVELLFIQPGKQTQNAYIESISTTRLFCAITKPRKYTSVQVQPQECCYVLKCVARSFKGTNRGCEAMQHSLPHV